MWYWGFGSQCVSLRRLMLHWKVNADMWEGRAERHAVSIKLRFPRVAAALNNDRNTTVKYEILRMWFPRKRWTPPSSKITVYCFIDGGGERGETFFYDMVAIVFLFNNDAKYCMLECSAVPGWSHILNLRNMTLKIIHASVIVIKDKHGVYPNNQTAEDFSNVRRDTCRMFRKKKRDYMKEKVIKLEENSKKKKH